MSMKRSPSKSLDEIKAAAKVACQETEFERRKRQRTQGPDSKDSKQSSDTGSSTAIPSPNPGGTTFTFSVRAKQAVNTGMGTSMSKFRVPQAVAPAPMAFNVPVPPPFTFIVPFGMSKPLVTPRPIEPVLVGPVLPSSSSTPVPQPLPTPIVSQPVAFTKAQVIQSQNTNERAASEEGSTGTGSGMPGSTDSEASFLSSTTNNEPPVGRNDRLKRLTRSNRVDLALTLLQDGGIDFAEFLIDALDPSRPEFSTCQDQLYEGRETQLSNVLDMIIRHPRGKQQLKDWIKGKVENA
ncbi:hypothetical protein PC9H_007971 [Pleurotus ostreatus]|uniref:Uncharacterized protein n=1 Tax=Pleurotus ostreatus TaxID=5322 RepID=A0A8H6ZUH0_PLEOS|nr:uncharacterized protein PC9H_007971 [Pleurotus ostreatus]KAF7428739.1 hypothetical protein PC9H_007971 [Pleurotus ostreatus]KAJ8696941.1 hypothetical protein PTI98_006763 [Pleurotus ostreatus]